jgi:hypothetical protein
LRRVRHDLVKRVAWPARDLRDSGATDLGALRRGLEELRDDEGAPIDALSLWARLREGAPKCSPGALDTFGEAVARAHGAAAGSDFAQALDSVFDLERAFDVLARSLDVEG